MANARARGQFFLLPVGWLIFVVVVLLVVADVECFFSHYHDNSDDRHHHHHHHHLDSRPFSRRRPPSSSFWQRWPLFGISNRRPTTTTSSPEGQTTSSGRASVYWRLVNEANTWQAQNADACGVDTPDCAIQTMLAGFDTCSAVRIVNGCRVKTHGVVGWQVAVTIGSGLCGGTIISPNIILLAAHCLQSTTRASQIAVHIGATDIFNRATSASAQTYAVESFAQNPSFNYESIVGDSAVLRLARSIVMSQTNGSGVRPACLATSTTPRTLKNCIVSGYGKNRTTSSSRNGGGGGAGVLRYTVLDMVSDSRCAQTYGEQFEPQVSFCALGSRQSAGTDTCGGDSGSGLTCKDSESGRWVVRGIVSYGVPQCGSEPGVYADAFALGLRGSSAGGSSSGATADRCVVTTSRAETNNNKNNTSMMKF